MTRLPLSEVVDGIAISCRESTRSGERALVMCTVASVETIRAYDVRKLAESGEAESPREASGPSSRSSSLGRLNDNGRPQSTWLLSPRDRAPVRAALELGIISRGRLIVWARSSRPRTCRCGKLALMVEAERTSARWTSSRRGGAGSRLSARTQNASANATLGCSLLQHPREFGSFSS